MCSRADLDASKNKKKNQFPFWNRNTIHRVSIRQPVTIPTEAVLTPDLATIKLEICVVSSSQGSLDCFVTTAEISLSPH